MSAGEGPTGVRALDLSEKGVQSWIGAASPGSRPQRLERQEHRESETEGHSVVADSATAGGSPGQNPGVGVSRGRLCDPWGFSGPESWRGDQSWPTLRPRGVLWARILEWAAVPFSRKEHRK